jgi:DnaD/phage-associated family protein
MKTDVSWSTVWMNRLYFILDHLEELDLSALEALALVCMEYMNEVRIPITHEKIASKLSISPEMTESVFEGLSDKGYLTFAMNQGRLEFCLDGVFDRGMRRGEPMAKSLIREFEDAFGRDFSSQEMQRIVNMASTYTEDWVLMALDEACAYEKRDLYYIERILASWKNKNLSTEDLRNGIRNERK